MVHFCQTFFVYLELIMHFSIRDAGANCIGRPFILSHQKLVVAYEKKSHSQAAAALAERVQFLKEANTPASKRFINLPTVNEANTSCLEHCAVNDSISLPIDNFLIVLKAER